MKSGNVIDLLSQLVQIPSINPTLNPQGSEVAIVDYCASMLAARGFDVELVPVSQGRTNVLGWIRGGKEGLLVCESHLDTVPESHESCAFDIRGGKMYGRGACDTKASGAAMITAMQSLAQDVSFDDRPTMVFAGAIDEEAMMTGAIALLPSLASADMVIVGEPTELVPLRAHNGILRFDLTISGETAHSAIANAGTNAIVHASQLIVKFEQHKTELLKHALHQLTGQGTFTLTHITGGVATNMVPDRCELKFDRRLVPGEDVEEVLRGIDVFLNECRAEGIDVVRSAPTVRRQPMELGEQHRLVTTAEEVCSRFRGKSVIASGATFCTDASVFSGESDIPCIILGPGSIAQAHVPDEWVDLAEVEAAVGVYYELLKAWFTE